MSDRQTIFQCCTVGRDVNKTLRCIHCETGSMEAMNWLEENGGGVYRNILHNYEIPVTAVQQD